jgi:hypothetical protein
VKRFVALALACLAFFSAACGEGSRVGALARDVGDALGRTRDLSRTYRFTDYTLDGSQKIEVIGRIQDDLKYAGVVSVDGHKVYEEIVSDDSVALRILDSERAKKVIDTANRVDPISGRALAEGRWVVDHTVAPPLLAARVETEDEDERTADKAATETRGPAIGDDPFVDSAQTVNYAIRVVRGSPNVQRFNPEDIDYVEQDDPFRADAEIDLEEQGIRRYDLQQPPLPRPAQRGQRQRLPSVDTFRKMAVYVKGERAIKLRERIAIDERTEFRRAEEGRTAKFYLVLRDAAKQGAISGEMRERTMEYEIMRTGTVNVSLPANAEEGLLSNVLPDLKSLFKFKYIGTDAPGGAGAGPLPSAPVESPTAPGAPAASAAPISSP